jgi:hypothetical protein
VLQDAVVRVWAHRERVRAHPNPGALVQRIAIHAAIDVLRRETRRRHAEESARARGRRGAAVSGPAMEAEQAEVRRLVLDPTRVRFDGEDVAVAWSRGVTDAAPSLVVPAAAALPLDADVEPVRAYLTPAVFAATLDAPGMTATIDPATRLPLRLAGTDRNGRKQAADCRWP